MRTLIYKSDEGCRKGCHPVFILRVYRGKIEEDHYFSVDEPGAWWADDWNCHVDGCDYPCKSRQEAIKKGASVLYDPKFHGDENIKVYYEE